MEVKRYLWIFLTLLCCVGCDSLEDTYSDYAGDGPRRYLGKCTDVEVAPGWKRLQVSWVNGVDPVVKNIKVTWSRAGNVRDTLLPKDATACNILNLEEGDYEIKVCGIDEKNNVSFDAITYSRPYTENHEAVRAFTRVVSKHFFVKNRLVLFFDNWDENTHEARLCYTTIDGTSKSLQLKDVVKAGKYYLLPETIDPTQKVVVEREGYIVGCTDLITFEPIEMKHERTYVTDFKLWMKSKYGQVNISDDFANNLKELEIDYSISSLEDILHFPNLEKLHLGKNRFLADAYLRFFAETSEIFEWEKTLFALNVANEVLGLKIDRYNKHFLPVSLSYVTEKGNPVPPVRSFYDMSAWTFKSFIEDEFGYDSHLEWLFDGNPATAWQPDYNPTKARLHEIQIDMKERKSLNGIRVCQKDFNPETEDQLLNWLPGIIMIQVSQDGIYWKNATEASDYSLGNTTAEMTDIVFLTPVNARYLKFLISDQRYGANYSVTLAEIGVF